ncbi:MAG: DUF262 domain-containing protein [Opitutales bacterium]|nr:DUF262 domain-containing protein [Opitutales bacterium]
MKATLKQDTTIRNLVEGYTQDPNNDEVRALGGKLIIRPKYQREFCYKLEQQKAVIYTILGDLPLGTMYWAKSDEEPSVYELLDGQQRMLSICSYVIGSKAANGNISDFSVEIPEDPQNPNKTNPKSFAGLDPTTQNKIRNYDKLQIYVLEGTAEEKIKWFKTANIQGERLTEQEIRNASYTGSWLTSAKSYFSIKKTDNPADKAGGYYLKGDPLRQDYLETVLGWISAKKYQENEQADARIVQYMHDHQKDADAHELIQYFENVANWARSIFGVIDIEDAEQNLTKGLPWGLYYNDYKDNLPKLDSKQVRKDLEELWNNLKEDNGNEVKDKKAYKYLLEKYRLDELLKNNKLTQDEYEDDIKAAGALLTIRAFKQEDKLRKYKEQKHKCAYCHEEFAFNEMEGDHIKPVCKGGRTTYDNLQMLCRNCNRKKGGK